MEFQMRNRIRLNFFVSLLSMTVVAQALPSARSKIDATMRQVEVDARRGNLPPLVDAAKAMSALAEMPDLSRADRALAYYSAAHAHWRRVPLLREKPDEASAAIDLGLQALDQAVAADATLAEAYALQAALMGLKIANAPHLGASWGARVGAAQAKARSVGRLNPRVELVEGMGALFTPAEYGGGADVAESALRRSLSLFEQERSDKEWPNWGRFDVHVWLGQALAARGDKALARAHYEKALAIEPQSDWVRHALLPQVSDRGKK